MVQATLDIRRKLVIGRLPRMPRSWPGDFRVPRFVLRGPLLAVLAFPWLFGAGALAQHYANPPVEAETAADDRAALVALYNAAGGADWYIKWNWLSDAPIGAWFGIVADGNGRVLSLELGGNRLSGTIPVELGGLTELWSLSLRDNQLNGPIPAGLGGLTRLVRLELDRNQLSGPIPAGLGRLVRLEELHLDRNRLSGRIPADLGELAGLRILNLYDNQLSGTIPAQLGRLAKLRYIDLYNNQLSGPIPTELGGLANLEYLSLYRNRLSGPIPPEWGGLTRLRIMDLRSNRLSGPIPAELGGLDNLEHAYLGDNQFTGCIPSGLRDVPNNDFPSLGLEFCEDSAGPELAVSSASVGDAGQGAGESFTLSVTVRNQGDRESAATTLRYYRSADPEISTSDTPQGTEPVAGIVASGTHGGSIGLTAPSSAGTYYYGACVDAVPGEADTGNNCSAAVAITVGVGGAAQVFDLHEDNGRSEGIAWAAGSIHVVDASDDKVYAYGSGGQHEPASDFDLDAGNGRSEGIAWAVGRFHVVDRGADKVFAYMLDGSRDESADFDLHADNGSPTGIVWAAGLFYVVDRTDDKAYAYGSGGQRESASDFDLRGGNGNPAGIAWSGERFYVADATDDKVYAYGPGGRREPASDFDLDAGNGNPAGIVWAAGRFRVVDATADKVYPYAEPVEPDGGDGGTAYSTGDLIADLPAGTWIPDAVSGGQVIVGDDGVTVRLDDGGHIVEGRYRYTCRSAGGCEIGNRSVVSGTVVQTVDTGDGSDPVAPPPSFGAVDDSVELTANAEAAISVLDNDGHGTSTPAVSVIEPPASGTASVRGSAVVYAPGRDFTGSDSLRYRIEASGDRMSEATVSITVKPPEGKVGIIGTAQAAIGGDSPLAGAACEFAALGGDRLGAGDRLAAATADDSGVFHMLAPPDTDGHLICRPAALANAGLRAFLKTGAAQSRSAGRAVSPGTTVIAMLLTMEAARDPDTDMNGRAQELSGSLAGDASFDVLEDAAEGLFGVLLGRNVDVPYFELLIDAFGNGRIDGDLPDAGLVAALHGAIDEAEERAGARLFAAATRTFADFPLLAQVHGIDEPAPPPPIVPDPADLASLAHNFRTQEFARNPALSFLNANWAYARGLTGEGETVGMVDTGIYAAHEEFSGRLHDETVYTVLGDDTDGDGWPQYSYFKVGENDPSGAYPVAAPARNASCMGVFCKFYEYQHGSLMASLAVGARDGADAHGVAYGAKLLFRPFRQQRTLIGSIYFHPPGEIVPHLTSRHQIVREVGDRASIVSNSWLTRDAEFWVDYLSPFHEVLTPRYVGYQGDRNAADRALLVWSAGNVPRSGGPLTGEASVPSLSERQVRAASGGAVGLADLLLTDAQRAGLSAEQALRRAEQLQEALRRRWLAVVAIGDIAGGRDSHVNCALSGVASANCAVNWYFFVSARCGFASDWCVAVGPTAGGVRTSLVQPPQTTGSYHIEGVKTSEAAALASGSLAVLLQAYRDADNQLTVGTGTVLKRLKDTAERQVFDPAARHEWDQRNSLLREEDMIRSLIRYSQASDDDLRAFIDAATKGLDSGAPRSGEQGDRLNVLNRLVNYWSVRQDAEIHKLLKAVEGNEQRTNDLLAQLIRQVEWIDRQLARRDLDKFTVTDADVREIAITSLIGHGLIDLKAATDPAE